MRGSKTCGYGAKKKHRGKGSKGGKGLAGAMDHKRNKILKEIPEHIGKRGFKSLKQRKIKPKIKAINLRDLNKILEKLKEKKEEINLKELGYDKVLGKGDLEKPLIIKAKSFSAKAKEKIEKIGGKAIIE